eukprot:NODE_609_length_1919_cov_42.731551_g488_i0.p1 GENE.NODE_609_length_1919_cov_42.731551_g488_i0~~NODE_609_length_1919_cov_42.731551_g488_i0.p1  ORF type:complete len:611 (-),score=185.92 NODE_609_length_1919_cov_42.731551_g488_i0:86-1708(-)
MEGMTTAIGPNDAIISLENFDPDLEWRPGLIVLNSPRSVEASLRLGIKPKELLRNQHTTSEYAWQAQEQRRIKKVEALLAERANVAEEWELNAAEDKAVQLQRQRREALLEKERQKLQRMLHAAQVRQQMSDLRQKQKEQKLEERQRAIEYTRLRREEEAEKKKQGSVMHEKQLEHRRRVFTETKVQAEQVRREQLKNRAEQFEHQDARRRWTLELQRQDMELRNTLKGQLNDERQHRIKNKHEEQQAQKAARYLAKQANVEKALEEVKAFQEAQKEEVQQRQEERMKHIQEAVARSEQVKFEKLMRMRESQAKAEEKREEIELKRAEDALSRQKLAAEREVKRTEALSQVAENDEARVQSLLERQAQSEAAQELLQVHRDITLRRKQLHDQIRSGEREENLDRWRRVQEYKRFQLLQKLDKKTEKADAMKAQLDELARERKGMAEVLRQKRFVMPENSPGPADYYVDPSYAATSEYGSGPAIRIAQDDKTRGSALTQSDAVFTPGPGTYDGPSGNLKARSQPRFSFPRDKRQDPFVQTM